MLNCGRCGADLRPFNFLADDQAHYFSQARLVGFSDPNGLRCENTRKCTTTYYRGEDGALHEVVASKVRYDYREDLGESGGIWEIVEEWVARE